MIGDCPTQLDKIDQWLYDNFGILPGACSSTENLRYSVARRVAEALWPKTQILSSDVDEAAEREARRVYPYEGGTKGMICETSIPIFKSGFIAGAEWMKEKDTRDMYMSDNRHYEKVYELGKKDMKEQMLKDAVERTVKIDSGGYPYINITAELYDYEHDVPLAKEGELVRIIIVKED